MQFNRIIMALVGHPMERLLWGHSRRNREYSRRSELADAAAIQARLCRSGTRYALSLQVQFATRPARVLNGDLHDAVDMADRRTLVVAGDSDQTRAIEAC